MDQRVCCPRSLDIIMRDGGGVMDARVVPEVVGNR